MREISEYQTLLQYYFSKFMKHRKGNKWILSNVLLLFYLWGHTHCCLRTYSWLHQKSLLLVLCRTYGVQEIAPGTAVWEVSTLPTVLFLWLSHILFLFWGHTWWWSEFTPDTEVRNYFWWYSGNYMRYHIPGSNACIWSKCLTHSSITPAPHIFE